MMVYNLVKQSMEFLEPAKFGLALSSILHLKDTPMCFFSDLISS